MFSNINSLNNKIALVDIDNNPITFSQINSRISDYYNLIDRSSFFLIASDYSLRLYIFNQK